MKRSADLAVTAVFLCFIAVFALLGLFLPDIEFSPRENRYLQQLPDLTARALFSGDYTKRFEKYTTDQFPFRDAWTTVKARSELMSGKKENNGVFYCGDGVLISRFSAPAAGVIEANTGYLNQLVGQVDVPVYFALIPGAAEVEAGSLPKNAPTDSQEAIIGSAYAVSEAENVDMLSPLLNHKDEYIFYRTDHHWTSLGAFYGYNALRSAWGLDAVPLSRFDPVTVTEDFYGTVYSSSGFSWVPPDSIEAFVPDDGSAIITNYNSASPEITPLYNTGALYQKDKYSYFLGGNTPRLCVETGAEGKPSLCIIRDSYTDSLLPFLLTDFSRIDLLDLRYFKQSVSGYIRDGGFDTVLVIYSVENFSIDANLFLLGT